MKCPLQIINANPKRDGESAQGYALRVLEYGQQEWILGTLRLLIHNAELEADGETGDTLNGSNNILIMLHAEMELQSKLFKTGHHRAP